MRITLKIAVIGIGVLFLSTAASARPCTHGLDFMIRGPVTKTEELPPGEYLNEKHLYIEDSSLDCPILVSVKWSNKCKVGDNIGPITGHLYDQQGIWYFVSEDHSLLPIADNLFNCSR